MKTIADLERTIADLRQSLEGMRLARAEDHAAVARRDKRIAELELELTRRPAVRSFVPIGPQFDPLHPSLAAEGTAPGNVEDRCASCGVAVPKGWECCAACFHVGR